MADAPPASSTGKSGNVLTRKIGPMPLWAWVAIGFGVYYWYTHYGPGAQQNQPQQQRQPGGTRVVVVNDHDQGWPPRGRRNPKTHIIPIGKVGGKKKHHDDPGPDNGGGGGDKSASGGGGKLFGGGNSPRFLPFLGPPQPAPPIGDLTPPGQVATPQSPVYDAWTADASGVPEPQLAYAPMTPGSIYG